MCCVQDWLAPTPYSPCGSVFLLILFYCMTVSAPQPILQMTNHASEQPPRPSSTHALENDHSDVQPPAHQHDKEANDDMADADKPIHECVWALDFQHRCSASNLTLLPDGCLSSLLQHDVSKLPHALLSSLLINMCSRVPCPGFEAAKFAPYLRSPVPAHRYDTPWPAVWDTGKLRTLAFCNGMEPTVRFVWTIPTADLPYKWLFSKQLSVTVRGKEQNLCLKAYLSDNMKVKIAVIYNAGQNKECQTCELDVQFAVMPFLMYDQTLDAAERSLGVGIQLPRSMLINMPERFARNWLKAQTYFSSNIGMATDLFKFTQLVVCANIRFVARDAS